MKKLMIAFAAVAVAASVQASVVSWSAAAAMNNDAEESYVATPNFWLVALNGGSASDISVADGGVLNLGAGMVSVYGDAIAADDAWSMMGEIEGQTAANNGDAYALVIWDGNDSSAGGKYGVVTGSVSGVADDPPADGEMYIMSSYSAIHDEDGSYLDMNVQGGGGGDVPEPTSGLLVLLGVAGLALKRKRA